MGERVAGTPTRIPTEHEHLRQKLNLLCHNAGIFNKFGLYKMLKGTFFYLLGQITCDQTHKETQMGDLCREYDLMEDLYLPMLVSVYLSNK